MNKDTNKLDLGKTIFLDYEIRNTIGKLLDVLIWYDGTSTFQIR